MEQQAENLDALQRVVKHEIEGHFAQIREQMSQQARTAAADHDVLVRLTSTSDATLRQVIELGVALAGRAEQQTNLKIELAEVKSNVGQLTTAVSTIGSLQTKLHEVESNAQKASAVQAALEKIEQQINELQEARWKMVGAFAVISILLSFGSALLVAFLKK